MLEISFKYFDLTEIVFFSKIEYEVIKVSCFWFFNFRCHRRNLQSVMNL